MVDQRSATYARQVNAAQYDAVNTDGALHMYDQVKRYEERITVTALAAADYLELLKVPSGTRVHSIKVAHDTLGTTLTIDIGVYTAPVGDAVVVVGDVLDADILCDGTDMATARDQPTEILGDTGLPENIGLPLWDIATALTADPEVDYLIAIVCATSGTPAGGELYISIEYSTTLGAA